MENEDLSQKCLNFEQKIIELQAKANQSRTQIIESFENERNLCDDRLISYQLDLKSKESQIL